MQGLENLASDLWPILRNESVRSILPGDPVLPFRVAGTGVSLDWPLGLSYPAAIQACESLSGL